MYCLNHAGIELAWVATIDAHFVNRGLSLTGSPADLSAGFAQATIAEMRGNRGYHLNALILNSARQTGGFDLLDRLRRYVLVL